MSYVVSCLSGKGGVTKTSIARAVAVKFLSEDWLVGVIDIDLAQASFRKWNIRRDAAGHLPAIPVISGSLADVARLKEEEQFHMLVVDGAAYGSLDSQRVAEMSDLIIVSCRFSLDDMESAVSTINALVLKGVPKERFCLVFSGVPEQRTSANYERARAYLEQTPYFIAEGFIEQMNSITDAQNEGLAMNEIRYPTLRAKINQVLDSIVARLEQLTS
ncbi:P-loop NTPase [Salmonella enterica]|nr:P-loop NTPase [Salmonella enterica]